MGGLLPLTAREIKKWYRNPVYLIVGLLQPVFWIILFGSAFDISKFGGPFVSSFFNGAPDYITYMIGGILTITGLFTGMFSGINIIWDRRLGILQRFLVSPIKRSSIVFSRILASVVRIIVQVIILIAIALVIPNGLRISNSFTVIDALIMVSTVLMISFIFSSIFSIIAIRMTRMETIMGITNMVNLPLMFASYALFPPDLMVSWLSTIAKYNPVSWSAESIRLLIIYGSLNSSQMAQLGTYLLYLFALTVAMIVLVYFVAEGGIKE
ncbi:ABC-2 integral membrane protein [Thermoplasma volcanium GSS1]|uniref:ABC-2 integral membrane protein n=1 Tax=Thermoplasma volcanium (strain ATCC 51530 / DSM 4299 / JCM 9571 / NBRC 15438 / GSS1) TaxID=273116 RepID=Q97A46_THEVO|nr:ABC transporter permease [Thermoplasma volcanium]BAB60106.1 ABC-2 integral membrane protein [Thermoplasma volcanium GSS1]